MNPTCIRERRVEVAIVSRFASLISFVRNWKNSFNFDRKLRPPVRIRATCRNVETPENVTKEHETLPAPRPHQKSNYTGNQKVKTAVYFPAARNDRIVCRIIRSFRIVA